MKWNLHVSRVNQLSLFPWSQNNIESKVSKVLPAFHPSYSYKLTYGAFMLQICISTSLLAIFLLLFSTVIIVSSTISNSTLPGFPCVNYPSNLNLVEFNFVYAFQGRDNLMELFNCREYICRHGRTWKWEEMQLFTILFSPWRTLKKALFCFGSLSLYSFIKKG